MIMNLEKPVLSLLEEIAEELGNADQASAEATLRRAELRAKLEFLLEIIPEAVKR